MKSPSDIDVLIHYYVSPKPHPRESTPAITSAIKRYLNDNILKINTVSDSGYNVTEKGAVWLHIILNVPYPKQVWSDKEGNIIHLR